MKSYDPANWYWIVAGNQALVFSSASGNYTTATDPTFLAWASDGTVPTNIDTEANLGAVLTGGAPRPVNANVLDGYTTTLAGTVDRVIFQVLFNHENRIRTLAGQAQITVQQFRTGLKALL